MRRRSCTSGRATEEYARQYQQWWEYVGAHHLDRDGGSWWHELGPDNLPTHAVWSGKPDIYHAVQATLLPRLPTTGSIAAALRREQDA